MIVLITYFDKEDNTLKVSHGVDYDTLENVVLPNETPQRLGAEFSMRLGEWVLIDEIQNLKPNKRNIN